MLKFYRILLLTLVAVFPCKYRWHCPLCRRLLYASANVSATLPCKQRISSVTLRQRGIIFCRSIRRCTRKTATSAGWIQIDGTNINYPVMQSKQNPDFYLKHNFEKANSPHGCPYVQASCDLQTPSEQHPCVRTQHEGRHHVLGFTAIQARILLGARTGSSALILLTAQAEYTVMAVFPPEAMQRICLPIIDVTDTETPQEFAAYVDACKDADPVRNGRVGCLWGQADYAVHLR